MHPSPMADTSSPLCPSLRFCIVVPLRCELSPISLHWDSNDKARHWAGQSVDTNPQLVPVSVPHPGLDFTHGLVHELQSPFPMTALIRGRTLQALLCLLQILHGRLHVGL